MSGFRHKHYWRPVNGRWHLFEKGDRVGRRSGWVSACGRHEIKDRIGGEKKLRPDPRLRCGACDAFEIEYWDADESLPESKGWDQV